MNYKPVRIRASCMSLGDVRGWSRPLSMAMWILLACKALE
jgi:hypothetical protein